MTCMKWCSLTQWSRNKQKACLFCLFFQNIFLSGYRVVPSNTGSTNCIVTAFEGLSGLLYRMREDREWCRWRGHACEHLVYISGEIFQWELKNHTCSMAEPLSREKMPLCFLAAAWGSSNASLSLCFWSGWKGKERPRSSLYCNLETGKFSEADLKCWLR